MCATKDPPSSDEEEPSQPIRLVVRTWSDGEALLVRQILESYGIPCQVVSDVPHTVLPLSIDGLGEIRIFVPASRLDEARSLLAEHQREGLEIMDGGKAGPQADEGEGAA
jgi:hypothetical protein